MDCLSCGNCKEDQPTYYCLVINDIVINQNIRPKEKERVGWKKGTTEYEKHRKMVIKE